MDVGSFGMFLYEIITWPSHLAGPRRWNRAVAMEKVAGSGTLGQEHRSSYLGDIDATTTSLDMFGNYGSYR